MRPPDDGVSSRQRAPNDIDDEEEADVDGPARQRDGTVTVGDVQDDDDVGDIDVAASIVVIMAPSADDIGSGTLLGSCRSAAEVEVAPEVAAADGPAEAAAAVDAALAPCSMALVVSCMFLSSGNG